MIDFYLVTGFLGAGKTTFLKNLIRQLAPRRLRIVINEYGKVGVDAVLLEEVGAALDEINNGSIFCSCRLDKFEAVLDEILQDPPDAVVVEASGLSDPTAIRKILAAERYAAFRYQGAFCLVDAVQFHKVFQTARVCSRQLSVSDVALINKTDIAPPERVEQAAAVIRENYPDAAIRLTSQGRLEPGWMEELGKNRVEAGDLHHRDITLQKYAVTVSAAMSLQQLNRFVEMFVEDTYRVKGFVRLSEGNFLVDCVGTLVQVAPWTGAMPASANTLVALAGKGMQPRKSIKKAAEWYPGLIEKVE